VSDSQQNNFLLLYC